MASAISFLAGLVIYARFQLTVFGLPLPLFAGLVYAVIVAIAALLTALVLPRLRFMAETMALGRLVCAGSSHEFPEFGQLLAGSPFFRATAIVATGALCGRLLYGSRKEPNGPARPAWIVAFARWLDDAPGRDRDGLSPVAPRLLQLRLAPPALQRSRG